MTALWQYVARSYGELWYTQEERDAFNRIQPRLGWPYPWEMKPNPLLWVVRFLRRLRFLDAPEGSMFEDYVWTWPWKRPTWEQEAWKARMEARMWRRRAEVAQSDLARIRAVAREVREELRELGR